MTLPFSRVRRSTSVTTVMRSPAGAADAWADTGGSGAAPATGGATGTLGAAGTDASPDPAAGEGTVPSPRSSAGTGGSGEAWTLASLRHSIHSSIATISQAKIRRVRVWFIGQAGSLAGGVRRDGSGAGGRGSGTGHCAVRGRGGQRAGPLQQRPQAIAQRGAGGGRSLGTRHHHVGAGAQLRPEQAELFPQLALDAVAADCRAVDLARNRQAQPRRRAVIVPVQGHQRRGGAPAVGEDAVEFRTRADARLPGKGGAHGRTGRFGRRDRGMAAMRRARRQADRRLRPLARRRARILRPSAVFMRARKPWSRLRLRLLGWKVRLVAISGSRAKVRR